MLQALICGGAAALTFGLVANAESNAEEPVKQNET